MKNKILTIFTLLGFFCIMFVSGCGTTRVIDGIEYDTYGLVNKHDIKDPDIEYRIIPGNAVWGAVLFKTVAAPLYFYGFSLYEPVAKKQFPEPENNRTGTYEFH